MSRPYILIIDDEPSALSAMIDAMARRFGGDYQVVSHLQVTTALAELEKIKEDGNRVALIIADQWMPEMTGAEFLQRAHIVHPDAQRALLVAWGDKESSSIVLHACAFGQMENYILKPWHPPEVHLYPLVEEFLSDWVREHDSAGFLQMPGSRVLHAPVDGHGWYYGNTKSQATPHGFGQEETIKAIWAEGR